MLLIELCLTVLAVPLAFLAPRLGDGWFAWIERRVSRFAARRRLAVWTIFLIALAARVAVLPIEPIPKPGIHDEFSYLLMADTFAHGRVTNPTHPMWVHFETFHVNQQPTYCSKFFPAQGLFLALGQTVFHHPFWGVWLSTGLMCAAICWALQGWMPPAWAFLGGVLAIIRLGMFSYWANSYWGGSVAAFGGALVLGALPRIKRGLQARDVVLMGVGLTILANSRPYEGLIYSLPILIALALWIFQRRDRSVSVLLRNVVLPTGIVMAIAAAAMGYYFWKTTGSPRRSPYAVYSARYDAMPSFLWEREKSVPLYHHEVMERFYLGYALNQYVLERAAPWLTIIIRLIGSWLFFIGPALTLPFIAVSWLLPYGIRLNEFNIKTRLLLLINMISFGSMLVPTFFEPHYAAPSVSAGLALLLFTLRRVHLWDRRGDQKGKFLVRAVVVVIMAMTALRVSVARTSWAQSWLVSIEPFSPISAARDQLLRSLHEKGGQHLVIVRYAPDHSGHAEWVYNRADIDGSEVVWARDMGEGQNLELIRYFKDRKVWSLEPDLTPPKLSVYRTAQALSRSNTIHHDADLDVSKAPKRVRG